MYRPGNGSFFVLMELTIIPEQKSTAEKVDYQGRMPAESKQYEAEKKEVSENIKNFDLQIKKPKAPSPYDYNAIALKPKPVSVTADATSMLMNPKFNTVAKFLGVDTLHDWGKYYDKVGTIVEWAEQNSGVKTLEDLVHWISGASNVAPSFGNNQRKVDQLYIYAKMQMKK